MCLDRNNCSLAGLTAPTIALHLDQQVSEPLRKAQRSSVNGVKNKLLNASE